MQLLLQYASNHPPASLHRPLRSNVIVPVRSIQISSAQRSGVSVWLTEGNVPIEYPLRQAGQQLQGYGDNGQYRVMYESRLFRQNLEPIQGFTM